MSMHRIGMERAGAPQRELPVEGVADVHAGAARARRREDVTRLALQAEPAGLEGRAGAGDVRGLTALLDDLGPEMLVARLLSEARDAETAVYGRSIRAAEARGEVAEVERQRAMEQAQRAAEKSSRLLGLRGPLAKLVKTITAVVVVAVSALSGTALSGAAVAGMALALGAEPLSGLARKLGWVDEDEARWLETGLKLTGALLGAAGGAVRLIEGPGDLSRLAQTVTQAMKALEGAGQATDGGIQIAGAVFERQHARALADAEKAQVEVSAANDAMDDRMEELRAVFEVFERVAARLRVAMETQAEARLAVTQTPA